MLQARTFGPEDLKQPAARDELNSDRRFLQLRPTRDGAWAGEFRLTGPAGAKLKALLDPLARPRICPVAAGEAQPADEVSAVIEFENLLLNLLLVTETAELVGQGNVASPDTGSRFQLSIDGAGLPLRRGWLPWQPCRPCRRSSPSTPSSPTPSRTG